MRPDRNQTKILTQFKQNSFTCQSDLKHLESNKYSFLNEVVDKKKKPKTSAYSVSEYGSTH